MSKNIDIWAIESLNNFNLESELAVLSDEEKKRLDRFKSPSRKKQFAACRVALRKILGQYQACSPQSLEIKNREGGKPYLKGSSYQFNLSHSNNLAILSILKNLEIGVDVEYIKDKNMDFLGLAKRFFAKEEWEKVKSTKDNEKTKMRFYTIWTRKEAFLKGIGFGLRFPLSQFLVDTSLQTSKVQNSKSQTLMSPIKVKDSFQQNWVNISIKTPGNYVGSVAVPQGEYKINYKKWNFS